MTNERLNALRLMDLDELKKQDKKDVEYLFWNYPSSIIKNSPFYDEKLDNAYSIVKNGRKNYIMTCVNNKISLENAGIIDVNEMIIYNNLMKKSQVYEIATGEWICWDATLELDYNEIPDIYPDDFDEEVLKERHK